MLSFVSSPAAAHTGAEAQSSILRCFLITAFRFTAPNHGDGAKVRGVWRGGQVKMTVPGPFTMSQQAQVEFYDGSRERAAMDYAVAVNEEIRDLFAAGADIVQIDEPYMQARPAEARAYGLAALNQALEGVKGTTAVHICFGYAAIIHERPSGYSFLPELAHCTCNQVSLETAQSRLDCAVLQGLAGKKIILGVIDLSKLTHAPA